MKLKTINAILTKKFNQWRDSIEDEQVKNMVDKNTIITGGSIVSLLTNQPVSDYDMYFTNRETAMAVAKYYVGKFLENPPTRFKDSKEKVEIFVDEKAEGQIKVVVKSAGIAGANGSNLYQYFETLPSDQEEQAADAFLNQVQNLDEASNESGEKATEPEKEKKFRVAYITSNAITLTNSVQLILRFYGNADEVHRNFDFVHCRGWWASETGKTTISAESLEAIITKELVYKGSLFPICSMIRTRKFIERGWTCNAGNYLKMAWQISKLDLTDLNVLDQQLCGVDSNYFRVLIDALKDVDLKKVDSSYVASIIDRIF